MSYLLSNELGQAVLNYLGSQPYAQVAGFIGGLQQLQEIDDQEYMQYLAMKTTTPAGDQPEMGKEPNDGGVDEESGD